MIRGRASCLFTVWDCVDATSLLRTHYINGRDAKECRNSWSRSLNGYDKLTPSVRATPAQDEFLG